MKYSIIRYIRGLGIISSDSESARTYYHYVSDNQGSVRLILTDTTNDRKIRNYYYYDAFGESIIEHEDIHNRFRFNGEQYDPVTSQYYLRARYYNPVIGRFTQEDTYYGDGLNLYEYCRNNPVLYRDPSGHDVVNQENLYKNNKYKKAGFWERILKRKADVNELYANPLDEFSNPKIGPCESAISKYIKQINQLGKISDPIIVQKLTGGGYEIVNGHYRWAAAKKTGLKKVPIRIKNYSNGK